MVAVDAILPSKGPQEIAVAEGTGSEQQMPPVSGGIFKFEFGAGKLA